MTTGQANPVYLYKNFLIEYVSNDFNEFCIDIWGESVDFFI